jgi:hypothetical protein
MNLLARRWYVRAGQALQSLGLQPSQAIWTDAPAHLSKADPISPVQSDDKQLTRGGTSRTSATRICSGSLHSERLVVGSRAGHSPSHSTGRNGAQQDRINWTTHPT